MVRKITALLLALVLITSCESAKQGFTSAYNMVNCKYSYKSISGVSIAGTDLSKGLNAMSILSLTNLLTGKGSTSSIPINFTVNVDVNNPNSSSAALNGLQYIIMVDDVELTDGKVYQSLNIASGETQVLPLNIGLDLATFLKGDNRNTILEAVKNIAGIGSGKSNITIKLKPTFMVSNYPVTSPIYIPVNFTVGK